MNLQLTNLSPYLVFGVMDSHLNLSDFENNPYSIKIEIDINSQFS